MRVLSPLDSVHSFIQQIICGAGEQYALICQCTEYCSIIRKIWAVFYGSRNTNPILGFVSGIFLNPAEILMDANIVRYTHLVKLPYNNYGRYF
jgi:hypothetical protein